MSVTTLPIAPAVPARTLSQPSALPGSWRDPRTLFFLGLIVSATGILSTPMALLLGIVYGMVFAHPLKREAGALSKLLLQASVVLLGFGINLGEIASAGRSGVLYTAVGITTAIALGLLLGRLFRVQPGASYLITIGTAICGGSAIAAVAPILQSGEEEISVSMGTVFLLNAVALFLFPAVGWALHLSQRQFGLWSALAIHDTSSVVGASARYGAEALVIGTTVKLARALWIIPVSLVTAVLVSRRRSRAGEGGQRAPITIPWFIFLFVLASVVSTYLVRFAPAYAGLNHLGRLGLTATLFLIGTGLSRQTLKQVGVRPLLQGLLLWIIVGTATLGAIYFHVISI